MRVVRIYPTDGLFSLCKVVSKEYGINLTAFIELSVMRLSVALENDRSQTYHSLISWCECISKDRKARHIIVSRKDCKILKCVSRETDIPLWAIVDFALAKSCMDYFHSLANNTN